MVPILTYLLKLSISLSVVYLFYQLVLRRLTFYNWNRWYLVSYTLLSFFIPFINISLVINPAEIEHSSILQWVPVLGTEAGSSGATPVSSQTFDAVMILKLVLFSGMMIMLIRLGTQLFSFRRMMKRASIIPVDGMKLYQVNDRIIPFSFGNSIFINHTLHSEQELREIILHEFVHVKQKHSVDIIWSELVCLLNWYNPFAWLIRKSIRQNLEFIADNKVLQNGMDRKQYQYLLLKVIGNNHFSIASKFNFSSLKKRIAMMNKMKSAGVHSVKFLFVLPLITVLLVAFRDRYSEPLLSANTVHRQSLKSVEVKPVVFTDTVPSVKTTNDKGYLIDIKGVNGECTVVVKDKEGKEVKRVSLNEWKEDGKYEEQYGEILEPPTPPTPPALPAGPTKPTEPTLATPPSQPTPPSKPTRCCSECPDMVAPAVTAVGGHVNGLRGVASSYEITDKLAVIELKDGKVEKYDITKPEEKAKFESKYGKIISSPSGIGVSNAALVEARPGVHVGNVAPGVGSTLMVDNDYVYNYTGDEDVLIKITKNTTRDDLEKFKKQMKDKGIELEFTETEFDDQGKLVMISGRMKSKTGQSNFVSTELGVLYIGVIQKGEKTLFTVSTKDSREPI